MSLGFLDFGFVGVCVLVHCICCGLWSLGCILSVDFECGNLRLVSGCLRV